jgi:hypothetical protein
MKEAYVQAARGVSETWHFRDIPVSARICDKIGASGHIPVKALANSNGSRYNSEYESQNAWYPSLKRRMDSDASGCWSIWLRDL